MDELKRLARDAAAKRWRDANKEKARASVRAALSKKADEYRAKAAAYYAANREKVLARLAAKYVRHPVSKMTEQEREAAAARKAEKSRAAHFSNHEKRLAQKRAWASANPQKGSAYAAKRRAARLQATPTWANEFFIEEAYDIAKKRTDITGIQWEVDHIVPLDNKLVCGLHVEQNLRVIPMLLNRSKGNRHWPDMP